jgi:predicted amidophosphoribosyltransferase
MVFCSNCGKPLADEANFCPNCGVRTQAGAAAGVPVPAEVIKDAFYQASREVDNELTRAAKDVHEAFQSAGKSIRESVNRPPRPCPSCGKENPRGSNYCGNCGKQL